MIRGNSPALLFFQNGEAVSHFLKFFPGRVASFLLMHTPLTRHKWGHSGAALSCTLQQAQPPLCSLEGNGVAGLPTASALWGKRLDPGGYQEQTGLSCTFTNNVAARSEYIKTQRPWKKPQSLDDI